MKLISHPKYPAHRDLSVEAKVNVELDQYVIDYRVAGPISDIIIMPSDHEPEFRDELWKMTCFEMFVQVDDGPQYYEYNFAPNGDWASYYFDDYRSGMKPVKIAQPKIILHHDDREISLNVVMERDAVPIGNLKIGLFAMIFSQDDRSFWALDHSESTPNFHQNDCFLHRLTAR